MFSKNFCVNFKRVIEFITLLNVEPFMFFMIVFTFIKKVPTNQLIQDKLCLNKYKLEAQYCLDLSTLDEEDDTKHMKSTILADLTQYLMYSEIMITTTSVLAALFIGPWTDKYMGAKKALMIGAASAGLVDTFIIFCNAYFNDHSAGLVLFSNVPCLFVGGDLALRTAFWSYIGSTTPPKLRAMRILIADVVFYLGSMFGTFIGGHVLKQKPFLKYGQLHNLSLVCIIGVTVNFIALLWAVFRVNEKRDIKQFKDRFDNSAVDVQTTEDVVSAEETQLEEIKQTNPLKLLFSFDNIKDMIKTCCKRRPNQARLQIWLLFLAMIFYISSTSACKVFIYQFVERVYDWDSADYSNADSAGDIIALCTELFVAPILIKLIKVKDMALTMIGLGSYFAQDLIRALALTPTGFYVSLFAGSLGSLTSVGIRTHISKIVESKELGKIFSLMSVIDTLPYLISATVFAKTFTATMDSMPGISFIIIAGLLLIPFYVTFWIDLYTVLPDFSTNSVNKEDDIDSSKTRTTDKGFITKL